MPRVMRVIIANNSTNITYEHIATINDSDEDLILKSSAEDSIYITFNGWLIAKVAGCIIPKRCLECVDEVFLDTRVGGV